MGRKKVDKWLSWMEIVISKNKAQTKAKGVVTSISECYDGGQSCHRKEIQTAQEERGRVKDIVYR